MKAMLPVYMMMSSFNIHCMLCPAAADTADRAEEPIDTATLLAASVAVSVAVLTVSTAVWPALAIAPVVEIGEVVVGVVVMGLAVGVVVVVVVVAAGMVLEVDGVLMVEVVTPVVPDLAA